MENNTDLINLMIETLKDTVRFYSENPFKNRAVSHGDCLYLIPETGAKCAIGRLLDEVDLKHLEETNKLNDTNIIDIYEELTTKKIKKLPIRFLEDLQELHDFDGNWDEKDINSRGEQSADKILEKIKDRRYA